MLMALSGQVFVIKCDDGPGGGTERPQIGD